jgi:hypothetical protein
MIDAVDVKSNLESYFDAKMIAVTVPDFVNELYGLYGTDTVTGDPNNTIKLSSVDKIMVDAGFGQIAGFTIPPGSTVTFRIIEIADWVRFYSGNGFIASSDLNEATATGPGYCRLDNSVLWGPSGYQFSIAVIVDGVETVVDYEIR